MMLIFITYTLFFLHGFTVLFYTHSHNGHLCLLHTSREIPAQGRHG